jgi:hypothetical protein
LDIVVELEEELEILQMRKEFVVVFELSLWIWGAQYEELNRDLVSEKEWVIVLDVNST